MHPLISGKTGYVTIVNVTLALMSPFNMLVIKRLICAVTL